MVWGRERRVEGSWEEEAEAGGGGAGARQGREGKREQGKDGRRPGKGRGRRTESSRGAPTFHTCCYSHLTATLSGEDTAPVLRTRNPRLETLSTWLGVTQQVREEVASEGRTGGRGTELRGELAAKQVAGCPRTRHSQCGRGVAYSR